MPPAKLLKERSRKRRVDDLAKAIEIIEYRFLMRIPVRERFNVCSLILELFRASAIFGNAPCRLLKERFRVIRFEARSASRNFPKVGSV